MSVLRLAIVLGAFALGSIITLAGVLALMTLNSSHNASSLPAKMESAAATGTEGQAGRDSDGISNNIQVHGDWTIEVRDYDGGIAKHTEFHNDLTDFGKVTLAEILARERLPFYWIIWTSGDEGACELSNGSPYHGCEIHEPQSVHDGNYVFKTLDVSATEDGELILEGTAIAQRDGTIDRVQTVNYSIPCPQSDYPDACPSIRQNQLVTQANLPSTVEIAEGQQVLVTVEITFE